jgi:Erv1 / Alr family
VPSDLQSHIWAYYGPRLWARLHLWAHNADLLQVNNWLKSFARQIPCGDCRRHWKQLCKRKPPDSRNHAALFAWTVDMHNEVNYRLGKRQLSYIEAMRIWRNSPKSIPLKETSSKLTVLCTPAFACRYASKTARPSFIICSLGLYGGNPHISICADCPKRSPLETSPHI